MSNEMPPWLRSRLNVEDFERRLDDIQNKSNERFVRGMISAVAQDGPLWVIESMARTMLQCRKDEMEREAKDN